MDELLGSQDLGNKEFWEVGYDFLKSMSGLKEVDLVYFNQTQNKGTNMTNRMKNSHRFGQGEEYQQHPGLDISQMLNELGGEKKPTFNQNQEDSEAHRRIHDLATGRASHATGRSSRMLPPKPSENIFAGLKPKKRPNIN
jgi:hypothetical protein